MKLNRSNIFVNQEFRTALPFTYFGAVLLKMLAVPMIKNFSLKTIAFTGITVAWGTAIGKKGAAHFFAIDFDRSSQSTNEHLLKTAILIISAMSTLFVTQKHPFIRLFPRFMHLTVEECLLFSVIQGISVSLSLLFHSIYPFPKREKPFQKDKTIQEEIKKEDNPFLDCESIERVSTDSDSSSSILVICTDNDSCSNDPGPQFCQNCLDVYTDEIKKYV